MNIPELVKKNMIVRAYAGSIAYGTNTPDSDVDIRGIFCADPINILTPFSPIRESVDATEEDTKYFELAHFFKLCLGCNPNIIELIHQDDESILFRTDAYDFIREHRSEFLSQKIAYTTSGYAAAQLKKLLGHKKWITNPQPNEPPQPKQFVSMVQYFGKDKMLKFNIDEWNKDHELIPYGGNVFGIVEANGRNLFDKFGKLNTDWKGDRESIPLPKIIVKFNKEVFKEMLDKHTNYWTWKKNRNEKRSVLEEQYGYDCYSSDTEFLTDSGWKAFDSISDKDLIGSFNKKTHRVEYQEPIERFDGNFTGNMYQMIGQHTDVLVTPNHNMYIRNFSRNNQEYTSAWKMNTMGTLPDSFDILNVITPKTNRMKNPGYDPSIEEHMHVLDYLRVMGWFVSDGTLQFYNGKVKSLTISQSKPQSRLTQTLNKQRNYNKIICTENVYEPSGISQYPEHVWRFSKNIAQLLYDDCGHGSKNKRLPNWVFGATKREMTTLLTALLQGDGTTKKHDDNVFVYYTSNSLLADDVQRLAFLSGYETSKWGPYESNGNLGNCEMYHVYIQKKPEKTRRKQRNQSIKIIPVKDHRIVCFMVKNGTLITRRNGRIGLHGNSKNAMHLVRLLRMGEEALTTGEILVKRPDAEELLAIRNGAWSYEELIEYAEYMDNNIKHNLIKTTDLPKKPDLDNAAKILMEAQFMCWGKHLVDDDLS